MVVSYKDDIATLDSAIGYDWQNPSMMQLIADGLMGYKMGTTELVPDLAESYTISADGLTYTFKLRPGRQISQRTRTDVGGRQVYVRTPRQSGNPKPRPGLLRGDRGFRRDGFRSGRRPVRREHTG